MKKTLCTIALLMVCFTINGSVGLETNAFRLVAVSSQQDIMPYSDILEWQYKYENGKLYKRQYNCTKNEWVGNWELAK